MKEKFSAIKKALKSARNALVVSHVDPDGDSIGSMLAMGAILSNLGIAADYLSQDGVPKIYRFLPETEKIKNKIDCNQRYDLLIAVDSSDLKRLGGKVPAREMVRTIINIDHHPDNTLYGEINYVEKSSSTAELLYKLAKYLKIPLDRSLAEALYVALITDTGNFRYENTSIETFLMAADLLRSGINTHEITTRIYDTKTIASIRVKAAALATLETTPDRKAAWAVVSQEMMDKVGAKGEDLIGLVDQIRSIDGVEVAILFREEKEEIKINFRSKEKINVSEIAKRFGGGGHTRASGAVVPGEIADVKAKVITEVLKYLKASQYLV
ncbi:MAG: bifunctional oligoribonuclease/PAP phosphatase NrnA [Candidatus Margulisbacteria bacterium]|nr:bifunctional oligoribonuclease/PAP phosphatase NrnA [Candidatus Margulisiibacteriota bacterium]